ncbi:MAG TPA: Chromate resistance protein ChrB [Jiangellaceae bacterium]|nr:Chromate resistance protein ChrB [Jiangellaceae bacterium]
MIGYPTTSAPGQWVLLCYRLPREPSTPRIAVWRKLKRLGVAQLGDGLVALPADARTREHLEWVADEVTEAGGTASVWLALPASRRQERDLAHQMATARAAEYAAIAAHAAAADDAPSSLGLLRRLRAEFARVTRRDFFPPTERGAARAALDDLATETRAEVAT